MMNSTIFYGPFAGSNPANTIPTTPLSAVPSSHNSTITTITKSTLTALRHDPYNYKDVKLLGKSSNALFKITGCENAASIASFIKNFARSEGLYKFAAEGKLGIQAFTSNFNLDDPNKSLRELAKKSWVIFTFLDQISVLACATGLISEESLLAIAVSQRVSKYAKQSLSILHAMMLKGKAVKKPDSPKVVVWNYCFARGVLKSIIISIKVIRVYKELAQLLAIVVGAMSLIKRKHFVLEKTRHKLEKKQTIESDILKLKQPKSPSRTNMDTTRIYSSSIRIFICIALIAKIALAASDTTSQT